MMASPLKTDICQYSSIYNEHFRYFASQKTLEKFYTNVTTSEATRLTAEEQEKLNQDINDLYQRIKASNPLQEKMVVISAGAQGTGKTVKMKQDLKKSELIGRRYAYICSEDVCLKSFTRTYLADLAKSDQSIEAKQKVYYKWCAASIAASHFIVANLIRDNYAFYLGSSSSNPLTGSLFEFLKKQGYLIKLIYVVAPDDVRMASIQQGDRSFIPTTEESLIERGLLLPQRINDTYFKYADKIELHYRDDVNESAQFAAVWIRNPERSQKLGTLCITDNEAYLKIKEIHDFLAVFLSPYDFDWNTIIGRYSNSYVVV